LEKDRGSVSVEAGIAADPPGQASAGYPPGVQVLVRDEQWLVRKTTHTRHDGWMIEVSGVSSFVRGVDAVFYERLDDIRVLDPGETKLVADDSPNHRRARLFLERCSVRRRCRRPSMGLRWQTVS
jgi:hypothetical protein